MSDHMTITEGKELTRLEGIITAGLATFQEVGLALLDIRDKRLYRLAAKTFEVYCRERFGVSKRHGNRLIAAAELARDLGPIGPENESQARELAGHAPDAQLRAMCEAHVNGQVTAATIRQALAEDVKKTREEEAAALSSRPAKEVKKRDLPAALRNAEGKVAYLLKLCALFTDTGEKAGKYFELGLQELRNSTDE